MRVCEEVEIQKWTHFSFLGGRGNLHEEVPVIRVTGELSEFPQHVGTRRGSDVDVVGESSAVGGGAGERVLLRGSLCEGEERGLWDSGGGIQELWVGSQCPVTTCVYDEISQHCYMGIYMYMGNFLFIKCVKHCGLAAQEMPVNFVRDIQGL